MNASRIGAALAAIMLMACMSSSAFAQAQPGQGNNGGRQRGGNNGQPFDPAAMRERYLTQIKEQLGSPDEEWKLLQPKLDKVLTVQRETRGGGGGGRNGGGRTRGGATPNATPAQPTQPQSAVAVASDDLRKAVADKATAPEDLLKKIATLRDAKEKAKADLAAAQKELRELLSARQEAVLITNGILD
ncbi:MAG: hypothetical protein JWN40_2230 [Phycisphaerales bacterium]|nr:hypothetical protein [Phycisphaerales bacterium]